MVPVIIFTLCPLSWCALSCPPCVPVVMPAIMSPLCPRLGARHNVNLVSLSGARNHVNLISFPCLGLRHHFNFVSLVLVPAIMSTLLSLSWCSPCQVNLVSRNLVLAIMTTLCPPSWFQQSCPDCVRHHLNLMPPHWCSFSCQT